MNRLWSEIKIAFPCLVAGFLLFALADIAGLLSWPEYMPTNGWSPATHAERAWRVQVEHHDGVGWAIFLAPYGLLTVVRLLRNSRRKT